MLMLNRIFELILNKEMVKVRRRKYNYYNNCYFGEDFVVFLLLMLMLLFDFEKDYIFSENQLMTIKLQRNEKDLLLSSLYAFTFLK